MGTPGKINRVKNFIVKFRNVAAFELKKKAWSEAGLRKTILADLCS